MKRRQFVKGIAAAGILSSLGERALANSSSSGDIPQRTLGHTGEKVSIVGLGGYHIAAYDLAPPGAEKESIRIVRAALDSGINFLDNCWDYNGGVSEIRMGKALRDGYREKAFLMTKIDGRDAKTASRQLEESLRRLQTDHVDLLQFHEVIRVNDPERIFAEGGALEAVVKAKQQGKVRYIGFTGHKSPEIHRHMLEVADQHNFLFDSCQLPLNLMDAHFDSFEKIVLPILVEKNIGVLGMKPMGDHFILKSKTVTAVECLHYPLSLPTSVVITGCDSMKILQQALQAARDFKPLDESQRAALLAKTEAVAKKGQFELYKTSHHFDGTYKNPQWLG
jgi:predicted aldo/keto reductase-like oxidoreductase